MQCGNCLKRSIAIMSFILVPSYNLFSDPSFLRKQDHTSNEEIKTQRCINYIIHPYPFLHPSFLRTQDHTSNVSHGYILCIPPPSPGNHLKFSTLKDEFLHHLRVFNQYTGFVKTGNTL